MEEYLSTRRELLEGWRRELRPRKEEWRIRRWCSRSWWTTRTSEGCIRSRDRLTTVLDEIPVDASSRKSVECLEERLQRWRREEEEEAIDLEERGRGGFGGRGWGRKPFELLKIRSRTKGTRPDR